jgi:hypothetical protein
MKHRWYVSYETGEPAVGGHYRRHTRPFSDEADAKAFVRQLIGSGKRITVGTINPVHPKQLMSSEQEIYAWLNS